ncbi:hypothetical protein J4714_14430 [Staphylococcus epidermidis]|nr:hypothetical protein [Staphylococcus epidermidis]
MNHVVSHTVRDSAHLLDLTRGPEDGSRVIPPRDVEGSYLQALAQPEKKLRIAVWQKNYFGVPVHPDCQAALDKAIKACLALGHEVVEAMPELPVAEMFTGMGVMTSVGMMVTISQRESCWAGLCARMSWSRWTGRLCKARTYTAEQMFLARGSDTGGRILDQFLNQYDLILTPTTAAPSPLLGKLSLNQPYESFMGEAMKSSPYTALFNMSGQPAMSVPMHWTQTTCRWARICGPLWP